MVKFISYRKSVKSHSQMNDLNKMKLRLASIRNDHTYRLSLLPAPVNPAGGRAAQELRHAFRQDMEIDRR
jgi:hypothetical protein